MFFTKYFEQYLLGRKFLIRTDHAALQWLRRTPDPVGQQARWLEQLAPFEFEIIHRPGIRHANADGVSRIPCKQCGNSDQEGETDLVAPVTIKETERWTPEFLSEEQSKDPEIMEFRELLAQFPAGVGGIIRVRKYPVDDVD